MAAPPTTPSRIPSQKQVTYCCGSCGYDLNLNSSNRNTNNIDSKYRKAIRKGVVSFFAVDDSRFSQVDEPGCVPYSSNILFWVFGRRTKLMCKKCGNFVGIGCNEQGGGSGCKNYDIRISALQPSGNHLG